MSDDIKDDIKFLTVEALKTEMAQHADSAEVAVAMHGLNITIPIGWITKAKTDTKKEFMLFIVSAAVVKKALLTLEEIEAKGETVN